MKRLDRLKSAFLAQVSHKLKTPLTSLSLGLQELERYAANLYPGDPCHQRLNSMREDMSRFSAVVSSLLRMQEVMVGQGGSRIRCDLAELLHEAVEQAGNRTEQHRLEFELEELPLVMVDHDRFLFALQQILDNAFKFSGQDGIISITLGIKDAEVKIVIRDNGCGIPKDELFRIFRQFYQVDPDATGQIPGFGLGLYCAREIIRQHGGSIAVESDEGVGTTVTVSLPSPDISLYKSVKSRTLASGCCMCELFSDAFLLLPV